MIINVIKDFGQINVSSQRHVNKLISEINQKGLGNSLLIELNLEGCQTDYPETPKLIDFFLEHLSNQTGKKELHIKFNGLGTKELYILYDIILEGSYFNIHEKSESDEELSRWKQKIDDKLKSKGVVLKITYTPENKIYTYGKN